MKYLVEYNDEYDVLRIIKKEVNESKCLKQTQEDGVVVELLNKETFGIEGLIISDFMKQLNFENIIKGTNEEATSLKIEKLYEVEFMNYTNYMKDTVSNNDGDYIDIGHEPFIIRESEFDKYMKYGGGFRTVKFVGNIII